ncbi:SDR family oxidoreductase [Frankia sp. CNm7]|uniref:SDR family oxidoreductase n=1 Tax=Frankia nepalensis TaxID=1836974 RepID=A0A937URX7_9ACTN|nr:SDR family oxidoreductase [Frankia nepalensis]MBL7495314.1 SDR family oxidoreductase [Frankia nepalensis]MBL7509693.1 SDR family oxidoreductase [Frankia nepalensis]MBL7517628.1 SDR family oxidoreductase [Frankia nepalensis]MBL7631847.1 SDR family oxidoreductase [Frankia nepalensis]
MSLETPLRRFEGRAALVTGAASGIGRAVALQLAAEGAAVLACDIDAAGLEAVGKEVPEGAGRIVGRVTDLRERAECAAAVDDAVAEFGRLDVLGNVAGVLRMGHVTEVPEDEYRLLFSVNTDAYFFLCQAAIPHLLATRGNIVNIASNAGLMGGAYTVVYSMTKGAVVQLTKSLAMEFLKKKIRINAIAPGGTDTALTAAAGFPDGVDWELINRYMVPRPMAKPEDIAKLFAFVASDDGRNIHGAILSSDGGVTAG